MVTIRRERIKSFVRRTALALCSQRCVTEISSWTSSYLRLRKYFASLGFDILLLQQDRIIPSLEHVKYETTDTPLSNTRSFLYF